MSNPFQDFLDDSSMNEAASVSVTVQAGAPAAQKYAVTEIHPRKSPRGRTRWVDVSYHSSAEEAKAAADAHAKKNNLHRMQVSATQSFNEALDTFEQAMAHKKQADAAMDKNDLESYHMHMSAHHESMGQWQESKGRQGNADKEYEKAEKHHELGVKKAGQKNESYKLDEKHTVGSPVEIVGGPSKGVKGRIGEVRPSSTATSGRKMYTVYHGANNTVLVPRDYIRAVDESEMQDVAEGSDKKLEFNSFAAAKQHFSDLAHERGTSPVEMYGKGDAERYRQHVLKHVKKKEQAVAEEVELDEARSGTFRAGSKSYFKAGQTAIKNIKAAAHRRREEEAKQEADAKKKVEEEFGLAEGYSVIWTDRNYKKNSKDFVAGKLDSHDSNERKARDFAKKLESNPDIRSVRVKSMTSEGVELEEKTLTPAELKKREEIAKAMEREKPGMDKSRKMAIATAVAKRVAEQYDEAE